MYINIYLFTHRNENIKYVKILTFVKFSNDTFIIKYRFI